jgi:hypothetical protein
MEQTVGVSYAVLMKEDAALFAARKASPASDSDSLAIPVRPLVIAEAIRQLGTDEFATRTGHPLDEGYLLLEKAKNAS